MSDVKDEESKTEQPQTARKLGTYYAAITKYTQIFSPNEPKNIFAQLFSLLKKRNIYPIKDDTKWKLTYEVEVEQEEEGPLTVQVKLLKIDESNICIDFMRLGGS